jgi:hypothetical protein
VKSDDRVTVEGALISGSPSRQIVQWKAQLRAAGQA